MSELKFIPKEAKAAAVEQMKKLFEAFKGLYLLYEEHDLNEFQPPSMQKWLPKAIEDTMAEIRACAEDWERLPTKPGRNEALAAEMNQKYADYKGWKFEYMYPGYFSFSKGDLIVFFTPDFDGDDGELCLQLQRADGANIEPPFAINNFKYAEPLTVEQLFAAGKRLADDCDLHMPAENEAKSDIVGLPSTVKVHDEASAEVSVKDDYKKVVKTVQLARRVCGYVGDDSVDVKCDPPAKVMICETREDDLLRHMDGGKDTNFIDPYWDIELLEPHPALKDVRSLWVYGTSYEYPNEQHPFSSKHTPTRKGPGNS